MTNKESRLLTQTIVNNYRVGYSIEELAEKHNLKKHSVIMRLVKAGVYTSSFPKEKQYALRKDMYAVIIEAEVGEDLPGLEKADKESLRKIAIFLTGDGEL